LRTLYQSSEGTWRTIHPRWGEELLSMLYNEENRAILLERIPYLQNAINSIFDLADETIIESVMRLQVRRRRRQGMIPAHANPFETRGGQVWQPVSIEEALNTKNTNGNTSG
jgi:hypothetical protein